MTLYDEYKKTDQLDDMAFIAGTTMKLYFPIYNDSKERINISSSTMKWYLSLYGQPDYSILEKTAEASDSYTFLVELSTADTLSLGGVYLQQLEITDVSGKKFRPAQGIVLIRKAIPSRIS